MLILREASQFWPLLLAAGGGIWAWHCRSALLAVFLLATSAFLLLFSLEVAWPVWGRLVWADMDLMWPAWFAVAGIACLAEGFLHPKFSVRRRWVWLSLGGLGVLVAMLGLGLTWQIIGPYQPLPLAALPGVA